MDFGRISEGTQHARRELELDVLNEPNTRIIAFRKSCTCSSVILVCGPAPRDRYDLSRVHLPLEIEEGFSPRLSLGLALTGREERKTIRGDATLTYRSGERPLAMLRVEFRAEIVREFDVSPAVASLGNVRTGEGMKEAVRFRVRSNDGQPFNLLSVKSCPNPFLAWFECKSMRRDEWEVSVGTTEKLAAGRFDVAIRLSTDRPADVVCRIAGRARPHLEYDPKALLFVGRVRRREVVDRRIEIVDAFGVTPTIESWKFTSEDGVAHGAWLEVLGGKEGKCDLRFQFQNLKRSAERRRLSGRLKMRVVGSRTEDKTFLVIGTLDG